MAKCRISVHLDGVDRSIEATIAYVSSEAEFTPKTVQTTQERVKLVYRIKIEVPNPAMELKPGMPADAEIFLGEGDPPCRPSAPKG